MLYVLLTYLVSPALYLLLFFRQRDDIKKILIIQTAKIGDLICSTPIFREAKKKYPNAQLTVMVNPIIKDLLEHNPHIDKVTTIENKDYKGFFGKLKLSNMIRRGEYDIAICLNPNVPFAIVLFWALVPIRLSVMPNFTGITFKLASVFYTYLEKHISGQLVIETYLKMLKAIGIVSNNITKEVYKSDTADIKAHQILGHINKPLIGIAVSSGNKLKELGTEKIIRLIDMILDNMDIYVVLIGSHQDKITVDTILNLVMRKDRLINGAGMLDLKELPALVRRLSLFIGVDTGITYMADALSIPLINIAGPADMEDQRPTGKNVVIIQEKDLSCVPCSHAFKATYNCKNGSRACIIEVSADGIFKAAKTLLSHA